MWKLAIIIFIIAAPTLAGIAALVPLTISGVGEIEGWTIILAVALGVIAAVPVSYIVALRLKNLMNPRGGHLV
ncbi:hypothetical protein [Breoghania sp.]|uniref:hypothetical protein n=1 Tax=Breoghania sp. TaxID=2065378 RepID=UPI002AA633E5|nr:hypothetical protein [Breoghania sp.]